MGLYRHDRDTSRERGHELHGTQVSFSALESRSALLRLKIRRRPYSGPSLARGIALMYRRNKTNGTWVLKVSDGHGAYWTKGLALADDFEDADARNVLTFHEAQDAAKKLARSDDGSANNAPITVHGALKDYRRDLARRLRPLPLVALSRSQNCRAPVREPWRLRALPSCAERCAHAPFQPLQRGYAA
jgi:hypothetical protein